MRSIIKMTDRDKYNLLGQQITELKAQQKALFSDSNGRPYYDVLLDNIVVTINMYYKRGAVHRYSAIECAKKIRDLYLTRLRLHRQVLLRDEYEQCLLWLNNYRQDEDVLNFIYY